MIQKQLYAAPEAELLVVRVEENFCGTNDGIPDIDGNDVEDDSDNWGN